MEIYVIGDDNQYKEIKKKVSAKHTITRIHSALDLSDNGASVVFDFTLDESPENIESYEGHADLILFVNTTRTSLSEMSYFVDGGLPQLFGFAGDPTFLDRPLLEVSAFDKNTVKPTELFKKLSVHATIVDDRVGMVTPRIISMIINEAYYTVLEKTASRKDIDTGMKLGTNYPMGPFEWSEKWGIGNIYELLDALYLDTREERYKICPLLKKEYLALENY